MKLSILRSDVEMLFESISTNLLVLNREMGSIAPSQDFGLAG